MSYRDTHDALYEKTEALERELEEARREIERLRAMRAEERDGVETSDPLVRPEARSGIVIGLMAAAVVTTSAAALLASRAAVVGHRYYGYGSYYGAYGCPHRASMHSGDDGFDPASGLYETHELRGRVSATRGASVANVGDQCSVTISPVASARFNCRIQVECGGNMVYGLPHEGYTRCAVEGERPVRARDYSTSSFDGDPELELDVDARKLIVSDFASSGESSLSVTLDPAP